MVRGVERRRNRPGGGRSLEFGTWQGGGTGERVPMERRRIQVRTAGYKHQRRRRSRQIRRFRGALRRRQRARRRRHSVMERTRIRQRVRLGRDDLSASTARGSHRGRGGVRFLRLFDRPRLRRNDVGRRISVHERGWTAFRIRERVQLGRIFLVVPQAWQHHRWGIRGGSFGKGRGAFPRWQDAGGGCSLERLPRQERGSGQGVSMARWGCYGVPTARAEHSRQFGQ
mmetsp:Transcript_18743/g.39438  ORF Transcript_18743/g.39438 Transcript_18743/m.39438 type:complete len:227 (+) Transcript_18743:129-809(+)